MNEPPKTGPEQVFDATPYLKLFIDKEGKWFQNGVEIIHPLIYKQFCVMLEKSSDSRYLVRLGREICEVEVEDAPFVVQRVTEQNNGDVSLELNDGTVELFVPESFWIGDENVPYTHVKDGVFHARFSRAAYYQVAHYIAWDEADQQFYVTIRNRRVAVRTTQSHASG